AGESDLHPSWEEERRLAFTKRFWPFFYTTVKCEHFRTTFLEVLWPRVDEIIDHHEANVPNNANAGPEFMKEILTTAKLKSPDWPPVPKKPTGGGFSRDLDDEIPF